VTQVSSFKADMQLNDPRFPDIVPEPWWGGPSAVMTTIFPSVILQQQVNSVSMRHIQPVGHGAFKFEWTHFGFEDDDAAMTQRRLRQANLFGPAGFVSADNGEVIEFSQTGFESKPFHRALVELGGRDVGAPRVLSVDGGTIHAEANYAVFRTKLSELTKVFNVGRYLDEVIRTPSGLKFASRLCIYESEMIPNSIIYPI
jgi:hypothetical protein